MDQTDFLIIGAGVVGLAIASEISGRFPENTVTLLDKYPKFGQETSSRNSEVIHAGMYYPENSLKAKLCVEGNRLMYEFCKKWNIPHERTGKLIVANTDKEISTLESILIQGKKNDIEDLKLLNRSEITALEPEICAKAAVLSPSTGTVDSHSLMKRLEQLALNRKTVIAYKHEVLNIEPENEKYRIFYSSPDGSVQSILSSWLINSSGLSSDKTASLMGIDIDEAGYRLHPCKGEYFSIPPSKAKRVSHLIYPPPFKDLRGLGIHLTRFPDKSVKLGPNAFYIDEEDYSVDSGHAVDFFNSIKDYLPFLELKDLTPDMAGIRPKIQKPGKSIHDFIICHEKERGLKRVINLIGIESPGLTSCLSLARLVGNMIFEA